MVADIVTVAPAHSDVTKSNPFTCAHESTLAPSVPQAQAYRQEILYDIDLSQVSTCQGSTRTSDEGMEYFRTVVWPRMKTNGWRFEKGPRPKDRFWIPPGIDRSNPQMKSRRDYFDSMRRVIDFLQLNPWHLAKNSEWGGAATTTPTTTDTNDKAIKVANHTYSHGATQVTIVDGAGTFKDAEAESWNENQKTLPTKTRKRQPHAALTDTILHVKRVRSVYNASQPIAVELKKRRQGKALPAKSRGLAELQQLLCRSPTIASDGSADGYRLEQILPRFVATLRKYSSAAS